MAELSLQSLRATFTDRAIEASTRIMLDMLATKPMDKSRSEDEARQFLLGITVLYKLNSTFNFGSGISVMNRETSEAHPLTTMVEHN